MDTYAPSQAAKMVGVSVRTLRRYAADYQTHLSEQASQTGKKRFYTDQDVIILRKVKELTKQRRNTKEIEKLINVIDEPQESALALIPSILTGFENIRTDLADLHQEQTNLSQDQQTAKDYQRQLHNWLSLPWWKRMFSNPPAPPE